MKITPKTIAETVFHLYRAAENDEARRLAVRAIAGLIVRKNLEHLLPRVGAELERLENKAAGIVEAEAVTAFPVSDSEHHKIKKFLAEELKIEAEKLMLAFREDKDILGGFIVKTEEALIDRSINQRLDKLKEKILG
ncbi:MAG: F0F1 ATP synthase subunit delta [Candidatus Niyogibacteria bacterium]|nr:F0F1 ATP synthase subunit delta [Candidatus Niyogibacteria bacterium]